MIIVVILAPYGGGKVIADGAHVEIEICVGGVVHCVAFRCVHVISLTGGSDNYSSNQEIVAKPKTPTVKATIARTAKMIIAFPFVAFPFSL